MSVKRYAQFIAEQQRRMEVAGLAEANSTSGTAAEASKILKSSWTSSGNNNAFHKRNKNNIKVDYVMDKQEAEHHANKHVKLLSKHGINATPEVLSLIHI